jgi:DNA-directed RNA polymerase specialized sigma24 family protein
MAAAAWPARWAQDDAAEALYRMARRVVARSLRPVRDRMLDGEDFVQEAVLRAYRATRRLPPGIDPGQARGWLYRVMRLAVWDALARAHRSAETKLDPVRIEVLEDADDHVLLAAADLMDECVAGRLSAIEAVRMVIPLLTPLEREALALRVRDLAAGRLKAMPTKRLDNALVRVQRKARRVLAGDMGLKPGARWRRRG